MTSDTISKSPDLIDQLFTRKGEKIVVHSRHSVQ
jgi:hypothetical protein